MLKFGRAYYYNSSFLRYARGVASGFRVKLQPDALIFGFKQLLKGWTVMDKVNEIKAPTLVLAGRDDFQFPPEHQVILADRIPNAQLEIVERAGHNAPMERPDAVIRIVRRFMTTEQP